MSKPHRHHIIIVETRKIIARSIQAALLTRDHSLPAHMADSVDEAMRSAFDALTPGRPIEENPRIIFVVGITSYWNMLDLGARIRAGFPNAVFVLIDDHAKRGCGVVAMHLPIRGYLTLYDTPEDACDCIENVIRGAPFLSSYGRQYLTVDWECRSLKSLDTLLKEVPLNFSDRELRCFRLLTAGMECEEIAGELLLQKRSARNMKYRIMRKMGVRHFIDALRIAHQWGLFDR